jgi:hypothetical protein
MAAGDSSVAPIRDVEIGTNREFRVNGQPFFPIMAWLQGPGNFETLTACGMNSTAGFTRSGQVKDVREYLDLAQKAGLYGVMPFRESVKGHGALLGYIHGDEPDLPRQVSDAQVVGAGSLRLNPSNPLWKIVDGVTHSWSVFDPLEGASATIRLKQPVTIKRIGVYLTISPGLSVAKEMAFDADGKEIARAPLAAKQGQQAFDLPRPVTVRDLTLRVLSVEPGQNLWGSIGEIEGFDEQGRNVLASPPREVPRALPEATLREYREIKAADPSRPVFMTLTGNFHPHFKKYNDEQRQMYTEYIKATDVVGYDIYPIYGWNKPEWIYLVQEATDRLVRMAGPRPVYAWIETSKGSQWTGALENQKDVTPAHIRAEVWMAICRGATAIGYFTHIWKPSYKQFGVPPENQKALAEINGQITRLAPAILAAPAKRAASIQSKDAVKLDILAKEREGELYLFTVNYDQRAKATQAIITVNNLPAGSTVTVVDENRTIRSDAGSFADDFAPLAVHIYRIK